MRLSKATTTFYFALRAAFGTGIHNNFFFPAPTTEQNNHAVKLIRAGLLRSHPVATGFHYLSPTTIPLQCPTVYALPSPQSRNAGIAASASERRAMRVRLKRTLRAAKRPMRITAAASANHAA